jgi:hypothetical protein
MVVIWIISVFSWDCNRDYSISLADFIDFCRENGLPLSNSKKLKIAIQGIGVDHFWG